MDNMISEFTNSFHDIHNKCLSIIPIKDQFFIYLESSTGKYFTKEDRSSFKILCGLLGDIAEVIRLRERDVKGISGSSEAITHIRDLVIKYSFEEEPVLLVGETGVGKEMIAKAIHTVSGFTGSFTAVNVAGLDDHTFSDTLFGHVKGAFTGADRDRNGLVEQAAGGTLLLDEIGDLNNASQVKLLRLLQEGEY